LAIYHLSIKIFSRGKGRSAVSAAAYRAGECITNNYDGKTHDYTRRGGVAHAEIMLPENAPGEFANRAVLWNAVEKVEKARNSQLAREIEIALPVELTKEQNIALVRDYVKKNFVDSGMCADICIHDIGKANPHAHVMLTMRPFNDDKTWGDKQNKIYILDENGDKIYDPIKRQYKCNKMQTTDWNEQTKAEEWRKAWADSVNAALEKADISKKIDHRSYIRQGKKIKPSIKMGTSATQMERRGIRTERGDINREIEVTNKQIRQLTARIRKAKDGLYALPLEDAPSMIDVAKNASAWRNLNTRWQRLQNLQSFIYTHEFLHYNGIRNVGELATKAESMYEESRNLSEKVKKIDRRLSTLDLHLQHVETRKKHKTIIQKYNKLDSKYRAEFHAKYKSEIDEFKASGDYLLKIMNGKTPIPIKKWEAEKKSLTSDRWKLCDRYYDLKDEIKIVESLRRNAESIMKETLHEKRQHRSMDFEP